MRSSSLGLRRMRLMVAATKKVELLVLAGPASMSGKARKAAEYGVRGVAEPVFWRMAGVARLTTSSERMDYAELQEPGGQLIAGGATVALSSRLRRGGFSRWRRNVGSTASCLAP